MRLYHIQLLILIQLLATLPLTTVYGQRIKTDGTRFVVDGNEIFMNGVNTPWDNWNDFGGIYDSEFWANEFIEIRNAGGNCSRIWISCDGDVGINIDTLGFVTGATEKHWQDLDDLFDLAQTHKVYIMATMLSFDHTKNSHKSFHRWRRMIEKPENVQSYIDYYLIPFINRYKNNPWLWSIDACNEIEWINQDSDNAQLPWEKLQYLVGRMAFAVHLNSEILFTLGSAAIKWNSDLPSPFEKNYWSDESLQEFVPSPLARLDFYSPHWYGWVSRYFGHFCEKSPEFYQINDRPCMIGENPAIGVFTQTEDGKDSLVVHMDDAFVKAYENGWKGLMVWTSNGVDRFGNLLDCGKGLKNFETKYPQLINPIKD